MELPSATVATVAEKIDSRRGAKAMDINSRESAEWSDLMARNSRMEHALKELLAAEDGPHDQLRDAFENARRVIKPVS